MGQARLKANSSSQVGIKELSGGWAERDPPDFKVAEHKNHREQVDRQERDPGWKDFINQEGERGGLRTGLLNAHGGDVNEVHKADILLSV